jgi:Ca-activated chloride channel family protein
MSLRFENPAAFWALFGVVALLVLMAVQARRKGSFSIRRFAVALLGFTACVIGLARPQGGHYATAQRGMRGDLFIAVDISNSMRVQDISPSRLEFATAFVQRLLRQTPGLRVAIFPFAGDGYLQMPLSSDQDAASDLVGALTPSITTNQGTNFDAGLTTLFQAIQKEKTATAVDSSPVRVLLLSDGESHEPVPTGVLEKFRARSIPIDTVGVGTQEGGLIPLESRAGFGIEPLRDSEGKPVRSKIDPKSLKAIAEGTGGNYYGPRFEEVDRIAGRIMQGMEFGKLTTSFKLEAEYYPWLFLAALLVFSAEMLLGRWEYLIRGLVLAFALSTAKAMAMDPLIEQKLNRDPGNRPYTAYNAGVELDAAGRVTEAAELFTESAGTAKDPDLRKRSLYNLGNALVKLQDPVQALAAYQRAYDTKADAKKVEQDLNHDISQNILLAKQLKQQQQQQQEQQQDGEGEGDSKQPPPDPGKAKQFTGQTFDDAQKKRMYDLVTSEEQQVMQRLQQGKNSKNPTDPKGKPW